MLQSSFSLPMIALFAIQTVSYYFSFLQSQHPQKKQMAIKQFIVIQSQKKSLLALRITKLSSMISGLLRNTKRNKGDLPRILNPIKFRISNFSINIPVLIYIQELVSILNILSNSASSPKDDLESLGYILFYFLKKGQFLKTGEKQSLNKFKKLEQYKLNFIPEKQLPQIPYEFYQFFNSVKMSNITDYPMGDYEVYKKLFRNFLNRIGMTEKDVQFPWQNQSRLNPKTVKIIGQSQQHVRSEEINEEAENEADIYSDGPYSDSELKKEEGQDESKLQQKIQQTSNQSKVALELFSTQKFSKIQKSYKNHKLSIKLIKNK